MPIQQMLLGVGAATKTYVDDVFSTYVYTGNETAGRAINNGINLSGEGGLVWVKVRNDTHYHHLVDTVRGAGEILKANEDEGQAGLGNRITGFNNNGFTLGSAGQVNGTSSYNYSSWTWRKCPGFFTIKEYTGNGTNNRQISHDLKSVPGLIIVKSLTDSEPFQVLHRSLGPTKYGVLNTNSQFHDNDSRWNDVAPTSSNFTVGTDDSTNKSGTNYIAYIWAGGASAAATARSVDFDGSGDTLQIAQHADLGFGTGDYTVEFWIKFRNLTTQVAQVDLTGSTTDDMWQIYNTTDGKIHLYRKVGGSGSTILSSESLSSSANGNNQWFHIAVTRASNTTRLYVNGTSVDTTTDTTNYPAATFTIANKKDLNLTDCNCQVSNVRIVKGTAVYTSDFKPPTEPLTNITNTKLLCCNNSSTTGSTVTPGTITANGDPTASTDSPFDDPAGFVFGANGDQEIIKCGSYTGNGSSTGPEINLGWEPQWWLVKRTDASANWQLLDSMRGWPNGGNDAYLVPNTTSSEGSYAFGHPTSTGFVLDDSHAAQNANGGEYVYMAIRRSDGYVGKPPELGTDVFNIIAGTSGDPTFKLGFVTDLVTARPAASSSSWWTYNRLRGTNYLAFNSSGAEGSGGASKRLDFMNGFATGASTSDTAWGWKRHAGFDVVAYSGVGGGQVVAHSLNKVPEMIWIKNRTYSSGEPWTVGHKGFNGGTNPWEYWISLNSNNAEQDNTASFNDTAPTATHFTVGNDRRVDFASQNFVAMLFASVDGISKVGYYTGNSNGNTQTVGFLPRIVLVKRADGTGDWNLIWGFDTGVYTGSDLRIRLNSTNGRSNDDNWMSVNSTSFDPGNGNGSGLGNSIINANGAKYIYWAHA